MGAAVVPVVRNNHPKTPILRQKNSPVVPRYGSDYIERGDLPDGMVTDVYNASDAYLMHQRISALDMPCTINGEVRIINNSARDFWVYFSDKERFLLKGSRIRSAVAHPHICIIRRIVQAPIYARDHGIEEQTGYYMSMTPAQQQKLTNAEVPSTQTFVKRFISAEVNRPLWVREYGCVIVPASVNNSDQYIYPDIEDDYRRVITAAINHLNSYKDSPITVHVNDPNGVLPHNMYVWINGYFSRVKVARHCQQSAARICIARLDEYGNHAVETFRISNEDAGRNVFVFDGVIVGTSKESILTVLAEDHPEDIIGHENRRVTDLLSTVSKLEADAVVYQQRIKDLEGDRKRLTDALQSHTATKEYLAERDEDVRRAKAEEEAAKLSREETLARIRAEEDARKAEDEERRRAFEREKMQYEKERLQQKAEEEKRKAEDDERRRELDHIRAQQDAAHKEKQDALKQKEAKLDRRYKIFETIVKAGIVIATAIIAVLKFIPKKSALV